MNKRLFIVCLGSFILSWFKDEGFSWIGALINLGLVTTWVVILSLVDFIIIQRKNERAENNILEQEIKDN